MTDFIQGVLTVVFSFLLLPFVLYRVGGMQGIREAIPDPEKLSFVSPGEIGVFFIILFAVQALVGIVAQPFVMGVCAAGRTEMDGRVGFMVGNVVKRLCTIPWTLTALAALAWYITNEVDPSTVNPDNVYGDMAREFLPGVLPGLLGLFLASLLASVMSSCDSYMISSSGLFTENIYRPTFSGRSARHYMVVARVSALVVVAGGLVFAYWLPNVVEGLKIWLSIAPMMGIPFWMGTFWRRATPAGAWAAALTGFGAWFLAKQTFFVEIAANLPFADSLRLVWQEDGKDAVLYEPWRIVMYLSLATISGVAVSLLTRPVAREKLDRFYALIRTPIQGDEKILQPCTLPVGVTPPERRMLVSAWGLEIPRPSRTSLLGFLVGWLLVGALIGGFVLIVRS